MKAFQLFISLMIASYSSMAQSEAYISFADSTIEVSVQSHEVDNNGNLYILSNATQFYQGPGVLIEGPEVYGNTIAKLMRGNTLQWHKLYSTSEDSLYIINEPFSYARLPKKLADNIYLTRNNSILLPYCVYTGYNHWNIRRNALMTIGSDSGGINANALYSDTCCSFYDLCATGYRENKVMWYFTVRNEGRRSVYAQEIDLGNPLSPSTKKIADSIFDVNLDRNILFDSLKNRVLISGHLGSIYTYGCNTARNNILKIYDTNLYQFQLLYSATFNSRYYAINIYLKDKNSISGDIHLIIFDNEGNIISDKKSERYACMTFTGDDFLWAVNYNSPVDIANDKLISVKQFNIRQNLLRYYNIGNPHILASKVSVNNNELIISGTNVRSTPEMYPFKQPNQIYVYRSPIISIPLIDSTDLCSRIIISPNPAKNNCTINVVTAASPDMDLTLLNSVGQVIYQLPAASYHIDLDMSFLPNGMYILSLYDKTSGTTCRRKITHE